MRREEDAQLASGLSFEDAAAAGIIRAALRASKPVKRAYRESARDRDYVYARADAVMGDSPYRAGFEREHALTRALMAHERAQALSELQSRRVDARAGQVFNKRNLVNTHAANVGKIQLRRAELRRERGAFAANTYQDLLEAQAEAMRKAADSRSLRRDRRADNRRANRTAEETARHNREMEAAARARERRMREQANGRSGPSRLTPTQRRGYRDSFEKALLEARGVEGVPLSKLQRYLVDEVNVSPLIARAAAEQARRGGVSPVIARKARRRYGLNLKTKKPRRRSPADDLFW